MKFGFDSHTIGFECASPPNCPVQSIEINPGKYFIELWGAQGGNSSNSLGGKGAYSSGKVKFKTKSTIFYLIGEAGFPITSAGLQRTTVGNGGGGTSNAASLSAYSGGGMTYVSIDSEFVKDAILIAAGGGGASYYSNCGVNNIGGFGGASVGGDGQDGYNCDANVKTAAGSGATQLTFGTNPANSQLNGKKYAGGSQIAQNHYGSGGGGGYFGGAAGEWYGASGGGGSSYFSDFVTEGTLIPGNESMPSPFDLQKQIIGNQGHGFLRITIIRNDLIDTCYEPYFYSYLVNVMITDLIYMSPI